MNRLPAPSFSLIAVLIWGAMFAVAEHLYAAGIDAFNMTAIRYGVGVLGMIALLIAFEGRDKLAYRGDFWRLATLGTIGFAGFNLLVFVGLVHSEPAHIAILVALLPLIAATVRWVRDAVRPPAETLIAIGVALVGVALVVTRGEISTGWGYGEGLALLGVIGWALYTLGASDHPGFSPLRYTTLTAIPGTIVICLATGVADLAGWQDLPTGSAVADQWAGMLFIVVLGAVVAVLAWNTGVRRLGPPDAALFMNLVPVVALTIAIAGGYQPVAAEYIGTALVIAALIGSNLAARRTAGREAAAAAFSE